MNRQPYGVPPQWWAPKLSPWCVRLSRKYRWRQLRNQQNVVRIDSLRLDRLQQAVANGAGVLIAPNHCAHYDSAALYAAADRIDQPLYFMTAWQVFAMSSRFERWAMQRLGCFSVDRESTDRQAFKQAVHILQHEPHPLVIFPEGDVYHTSDYVTPFREGAAAIALAAAKRSERPLTIIPCGIKFWYLDDPTERLLELMERLEMRLYLRAETRRPLPDRIHRLAEAALALKELDYLGHTRSGRLRDRIAYLSDAILSRLEQAYHIPARKSVAPERVKALRQCIIRELEDQIDPPTEADGRLQQLGQHMEDLFFVMQLYSYRGDYLTDNPSIERVAETLDKFEEDILGVALPSVRGRRRVVIHFGEPLEVRAGEGRRDSVAQLTGVMQESVQAILNELSAGGTRLDVAPAARC